MAINYINSGIGQDWGEKVDQKEGKTSRNRVVEASKKREEGYYHAMQDGLKLRRNLFGHQRVSIKKSKTSKFLQRGRRNNL